MPRLWPIAGPHPGGLLAGLICVLALQGAARAEHRPLAAAASSSEELVRRFLDAVAANDIDAARTLAVTREEFDRYIYTELPASDPARNLSAGFLWESTALRSEAGLRSAMSGVGGRSFELEGLRYTSGIDDYPTWRLHRGAQLTLRDAGGARYVVRLFGSVLELDGQFKIYSYNTD